MIKIILCLFIVSYCFKASAGEGHDAGYKWAEKKSIEDPAQCESSQKGKWLNDNIKNSSSFSEGCLDYLKTENISKSEDEEKEGGEEDQEEDQE